MNNTSPPSPYNPDSSVAPESIEALRRVHGLKRAITERKILEALERLLNGTTIVLKPGYKLNQEALAKEAGIHSNTLRRRTPDGALAYAAVLNKLASHRASGKRTPQLEKDQLLIAALRKQLDEVLADRDKALAAINDLERKVIEAEEREREAWADLKVLRQRAR